VEAGKKSAVTVIQIQRKILEFLNQRSNNSFTVEEIANGAGATADIEHVFNICQYMAANGEINCNNKLNESFLQKQYSSNRS
jgi:hypothetical protein